MRNARWDVKFYSDGGFRATCCICGRVTNSKADLAVCPKGCHEKFEKTKAAIRKGVREAVKDAQSTLFGAAGVKRPVYG